MPPTIIVTVGGPLLPLAVPVHAATLAASAATAAPASARAGIPLNMVMVGTLLSVFVHAGPG